MRDYAELINQFRECGSCRNCLDCPYDSEETYCIELRFKDAADAIEELLAVCRDIASFVIHYSDDDDVSAEVLCRKLNKIGLIEKDGAWWTLPEPPKEVV